MTALRQPVLVPVSLPVPDAMAVRPALDSEHRQSKPIPA